jgi:glycosyltransferase involved in cell wall biosynthesis
MHQKLISVVTGCFNEEGNLRDLYLRLREVFDNQLARYRVEMIFIDNASQDRSVEVLKEIARADSRVKIIVNNRNFGPIRSGHHAFLQATGDAVVGMASDLQDPPELIPDFINQWEAGYKVVLGQKKSSDESGLMFGVRKLFYRFLNYLSETPLTENVTGFGLYDREVVEAIRKVDDPYPYVRGLLCELGFPQALVVYRQPRRAKGESKHGFLSLWDIAVLGLVNHSKLPLRVAVIFGTAFSMIFGLIGISYLIYKLLYWDGFQLGLAPVILGVFFIGSINLAFIGIVGEYIASIHTKVQKLPLVTERERVNF